MKKMTTKLLMLILLATAVSLPLTGSTALAQKLRTNSKILYHDGAVLAGTRSVYLIWYGCWDGCVPGSNRDTQMILIDFLTNLGGSPYGMINTTYPNAIGSTPSGTYVYAASVSDAYSRGPSLTESDVEGIVTQQFQTGGLPLDPAGIFVVLASSDVHATGFCSDTCKFHRNFEFIGTTVPYAFIGNPMRCPSACAAQFSGVASPNSNVAADATASWLAAVLSEVSTNPLGTGWYDRYGLENAEKCEGTFGQTYTTSNGAKANMKLGSRDYLIQQNWERTPRLLWALLSVSSEEQ